jgi:hypothetical protein
MSVSASITIPIAAAGPTLRSAGVHLAATTVVGEGVARAANALSPALNVIGCVFTAMPIVSSKRMNQLELVRAGSDAVDPEPAKRIRRCRARRSVDANNCIAQVAAMKTVDHNAGDRGKGDGETACEESEDEATAEATSTTIARDLGITWVRITYLQSQLEFWSKKNT